MLSAPAGLPPDQITVVIGLPHLADTAILRRAKTLGLHALVSANAFSRWHKREGVREWRGWNTAPLANAVGLASLTLDSAGFTALATYRGYPWTIAAYLDLAEAYPFRLFAAPDYCCEAEVAADREEVLDRMARTMGAFGEARRQAADRGIADRLMPVLQGRTPDDYERHAEQLSHVIRPGVTIGVGSMCRRPVGGSEGLVAVLERLDRILPAGVLLHGFGVKGTMLSFVGHLAHRITSVDSQAYGVAARRDALARKVPKSDRLVSRHLARWVAEQEARLAARQQRIVYPPTAPELRPSGAWVAALGRARTEIRALIAGGELDHDALTAPWVEQWAEDLLAA